MPTPKDRILLEGIEVPAALGVTAGERALRRPVAIDVELECDLGSSGQSDDLADTIDYGAVYQVIEEVAGKGEHQLVEALAERICTALLTTFPIDSVTLTVRKHAPVAGALRQAGVRIARSKAKRS
jgi:dihydroneopterin aldolase